MEPTAQIICERCGKALVAGSEPSFECPYCGAEVEIAKYENETMEERCRRLEREVERSKLRERIESQSSADWFWGSPLAFFSVMDRHAARKALERGNFEAARAHIKAGERTQNLGCMLKILIPIAILIIAALLQK